MMQSVGSLVAQMAVASLVGFLAWAAYSDYVKYIIPNRVCIAIAALYPAYVLSNPAQIDWIGGAVVGLSVFAVGYVSYAFRWHGGGDAKLLAATAMWAGPQLLLSFLIVTTIAGSVLSVAQIIRLRVAQPETAEGPSAGVSFAGILKTQIPYGVAISTGGLFVASRLFNW